jgi:hypothetical protein
VGHHISLGFRVGKLDVGPLGSSARDIRENHGREVSFASCQGERGDPAGGRCLPILDEIRHHPHKLGYAIDHGGSGSLQAQGLGDSAASLEEIVDRVPRIFIRFCPAGGSLLGPFESERSCEKE